MADLEGFSPAQWSAVHDAQLAELKALREERVVLRELLGQAMHSLDSMNVRPAELKLVARIRKALGK